MTPTLFEPNAPIRRLEALEEETELPRREVEGEEEGMALADNDAAEFRAAVNCCCCLEPLPLVVGAEGKRAFIGKA